MTKYTGILIILFFIVLSATSFTTLPPSTDEFKNLKVLPSTITEEQLDSVMDHFRVSLGVRCNFCHAEAKDTIPKRHLDFASDEKEEKDIAREMLKMTNYLNENFFNPYHSSQADTIHEVVCYTCHRGSKQPDARVFLSQVDSILQAQHKRK